MALAVGTRLGPYELVAPLGAGGMGEVYRARDSRLNRDVAIKVLPDLFAGDPERLARFTRESQTLAALNHPNIAQIHGLEESGLFRAIVMELVDGDDLSVLIARGPVPLADALPIARQIAEALEAAHDLGIVHRDLKPANIKVRPDGAVKVLDFGLAKALGPVAASGVGAVLANSPTITSPALTERGVILGTAAYMSPEQAVGKAVDKRSDLWALGVVLLEMLTGRLVFPGETVSHVLAGVLKSEPDWTTLPAGTPPPIRRLLRRCLEKDRKRRFDSAADARLEIEEALAAPVTPDGSPAASGPALLLRALPWAVAGVLGIALVSVLLVWRPWRPAFGAVTRIALSLPPDSSLPIDGGIAISPDGRTVVFAALSPQGTRRLYVRRLDEWQPRELPSTDGAANPLISPDGRWIAFTQGGKLNKILVSGGSPQVICEGGTSGGRWLDDGTIVFASGGLKLVTGLFRVSADGGTPQSINQPGGGKGFQKYQWPEPLPGGRGIVFSIVQEGRTSIAVLARGADKPRILVDAGANPRYVPTGHLVYVADRRLMAVQFDLERLAVRGGAAVVVDETHFSPGSSHYDISATGVLVYQPHASPGLNLVWKDRQGATVPIGSRSRLYGAPALSPDGKRFSVQVREDLSRNIWTGGLLDAPLTRLTFGEDDWFGVWSRDGKHLFYTSGQEETYNLFSIPTDGSGKPERLTKSRYAQQLTSASPAGDKLLFHEGDDPVTKWDIWELSLSNKQSAPLIKTRFNELYATFSPDGRWIAYQSNESGKPEVYVQRYSGPLSKRRVSLDGGTFPFWSQTGRELFYQTAAAMFAVPMLDGQDLRVGTPVRLFEHRSVDRAAISPDGNRFLMVERPEASQPGELNLVQNWFEELKARVPVTK